MSERMHVSVAYQFLGTDLSATAALCATLQGALTPAELVCLEKFNFRERRQQWIAGRIAAKNALRDLIEQVRGERVDLKSIEILTGPEGEPLVSVEGFGISISHSGELAAAAAFYPADQYTAGLDVEQVREIEPEIAEIFCGPGELEALGGPGGDLSLLRLWTSKEAVYKAKEPGVDVNLRQIAISRAASDQSTHSIRSVLLERYLVALALPAGFGEAVSVRGLLPAGVDADVEWLEAHFCDWESRDFSSIRPARLAELRNSY